jgi:general secretion pathway protein G
MKRSAIVGWAKQHAARQKISGFTLIEVLVVVVILAILAALVVPKIMNLPDHAKVVRAQQDVLSIQNAMDMYKLDNGFYPSTAQGEKALVVQPTTPPVPQNWQGYLKKMPIDPWDHLYQYSNTSGDIKIFSFGPTGRPGGVGKNAEIGNWSLNE